MKDTEIIQLLNSIDLGKKLGVDIVPLPSEGDGTHLKKRRLTFDVEDFESCTPDSLSGPLEKLFLEARESIAEEGETPICEAQFMWFRPHESPSGTVALDLYKPSRETPRKWLSAHATRLTNP